MKLVEIAAFGLDAPVVSERPVPQPGPYEVLVRIHANSLNYRDLLVVLGRYDPRMHLPRIPLSDGAGEVVETGAGVTRFRTGDRVAAIFMQTWLTGPVQERYGASALGGAVDGVLSDYVVLHEDGLVAIPKDLSYEEAATLPCAGVTAWNAIVCQSRVKPGDTVLIQGTGGVSLFALEFAHLAGARVIATSSSDEKLERAEKLGVSAGVNYRTTPQWGRRAKELTDGLGVDHVIEVGGAGTFAQSLHAIRYGGHIDVIGILGGVACEMPIALILHKSAQLHGIYVGSREMFEDMNRAITLHNIKPVVDRVFGISEFREALLYMQSSAHFGKIVIRHD